MCFLWYSITYAVNLLTIEEREIDMTEYIVEFIGEPPNSNYLYSSYEYVVNANNTDEAIKKAKSLLGNVEYHSTNCSIY